MRKIIFVSGIQIFPPESGGQLRSANLCRSLIKLGFQIEIYSFTGRKADYINKVQSGEVRITENLTEYVNRSRTLGIVQYLFYKFHLPPFWLTWLTHLYLPTTLKAKIQKCDNLLLDFPFLYPVAKKTSAPLRVNTHNAEYELYADQPFLSKMVKKTEVESFKKAETVIFCNDNDRKKFIADYPELGSKSLILPNGLDLADFKFNFEERRALRKQYNIAEDQKVFLFTGSKYLPNSVAFDFLREWSHQNAEILCKEKIILMVAGTVSETLNDSPYLKIVGKVLSMRPYFWASDFGINPIISGSGTNVKMIEFIAAKLPILTTPFGARGLNLINGESCFYFEESNFLSVIRAAAKTSEQDKAKMAERAFYENQQIIDMTHALKSLNLKW